MQKKDLVFRKAGRGYNKEDVNRYIIEINRQISDLKMQYDKLCHESNKRALDDFNTISNLNQLIFQTKNDNSEIEILKTENEQLKDKVCNLETQMSENDKKYSEAYRDLCEKAGEIILIASTTANDILKKSGAKADAVLIDANDKKEIFLKNLSDTATDCTDELSVYFKSAIDDCIKKINDTIKSVEVLNDKNNI